MRVLSFVVSVFVLAQTLGAVTIGQVDDFEDGTTQGWIINLLGLGGAVPGPVNVPTGGPAGADDNYLQLTATGAFGAGGRLVVLNPAQWAGDYLGIAGIAMDVRNFGPEDAYLRLMFEDPLGGPPQNIAISSNAVFVPAGSDWTSIFLPIGLGSVTATLGDPATALANSTILRIYSSEDAIFPPHAANLQVGVDNITAAVPEPATALLLGGALLVAAGRAARRRRC